jgi:hypothetical protein
MKKYTTEHNKKREMEFTKALSERLFNTSPSSAESYKDTAWYLLGDELRLFIVSRYKGTIDFSFTEKGSVNLLKFYDILGTINPTAIRKNGGGEAEIKNFDILKKLIHQDLLDNDELLHGESRMVYEAYKKYKGTIWTDESLDPEIREWMNRTPNQGPGEFNTDGSSQPNEQAKVQKASIFDKFFGRNQNNNRILAFWDKWKGGDISNELAKRFGVGKKETDWYHLGSDLKTYIAGLYKGTVDFSDTQQGNQNLNAFNEVLKTITPEIVKQYNGDAKRLGELKGVIDTQLLESSKKQLNTKNKTLNEPQQTKTPGVFDNFFERNNNRLLQSEDPLFTPQDMADVRQIIKDQQKVQEPESYEFKPKAVNNNKFVGTTTIDLLHNPFLI